MKSIKIIAVLLAVILSFSLTESEPLAVYHHLSIDGMKHAVYCMSALHPRDITKRSHDIISGFCKFSELQGTADHCRVLSSRFYPQTDAFSGKQILSDLYHSFFSVDPKLADREHLAPAPLICDDLYGTGFFSVGNVDSRDHS